MAPCDALEDKEELPYTQAQDEGEIRTEWEVRRSRFYNVGYKEGLDEGKALTIQQGFDEGYRCGTSMGYQQGLTRGREAALDALKQLAIEREQS